MIKYAACQALFTVYNRNKNTHTLTYNSPPLSPTNTHTLTHPHTPLVFSSHPFILFVTPLTTGTSNCKQCNTICFFIRKRVQIGNIHSILLLNRNVNNLLSTSRQGAWTLTAFKQPPWVTIGPLLLIHRYVLHIHDIRETKATSKQRQKKVAAGD